MKQIILVDGKNLVFRVHYVHSTLATKDGKPTSVLFGVLSSMLNIAKRLPEAQWAFVWDGAGRTWRHDLLEKEILPFSLMEVQKKVVKELTLKGRPMGSRLPVEGSVGWLEKQMKTSVEFVGGKPKQPVPQVANYTKRQMPVGYKANRERLHGTDDHQIALSQIPELRRVLEKIGIRQFEVPNLEGDDLIGILVHQLKGEYDDVIIHSTDKDFYQFLEPGVRQLKGLREGELRWASAKEISDEFRIGIDEWNKLKALIGDNSDNIPHLFDGVGPVTAAGWIAQGLDPSLEDFTSHDESVQRLFSVSSVRNKVIELAARWSEVYRNYRLCKIITDPTAPEVKHCQPELGKQVLGPWSSKNSFKRKPVPGLFKWLTEWLVRYEMAELYGRRDEFLRIP